jgi:hypothetical protein
MTLGRTCRALMAGLTAYLAAGAAMAQTTITQWNFNNVPTQLIPSTGSGSIAAQGGTTFADVSGTGSSDPGAGNRALNVSAYPAQSTNNRTAGIRFNAPTSGFTGVTVGFDIRFSTTASRYQRFQYTLNNTAANPVWVDGPLWTHTLSSFFYNQNSATVADRRVVDLSAILGVNNNPNFAFRVVSEFSPVGFTATGGAIFGPNVAYQEIGGGPNPYGTGGTVRFDMVTTSGTQIPGPTPPGGTAFFDASGVCTGTDVLISANVFAGANPVSTGLVVTADLTALGLGAAVPMSQPDPFGSPNLWTVQVTVSPTAVPNLAATVVVNVVDAQARSASLQATVTVSDCSRRGDVVISQAYGGGGNAGAQYESDFVELYNRSSTPVNMTGWSIQYSAAGTSANFTGPQRLVLNATLQPGQYYLVRLIGQQPVPLSGVALPTPDAFLSTQASATAGIFALRTLPDPLGSACGATTISDLFAYGTDGCAEGSLGGPRTSNVVAAFRKGAGCVDTDNNVFDLYNAPPNPRNTASPLGTCPVDPVSITAAFDVPSSCQGSTVTLTVTSTESGDVFADLTDVDGGAAVPMVATGPGEWKLVLALPDGAPGPRSVHAWQNTVDGRQDGASARISIVRCNNFATGIPEPLAVCRDRCTQLRVVAFVRRATDPAPGSIQVSVDTNQLGGTPPWVGSSVQPMFDDGTNGDYIAGDDVWAALVDVPAGLPLPGITIPIIITDDLERTFVQHIFVNVVDGCADASAGLRISQIYAGGGLTGAELKSDYVEIFNSSDTAVDLTGKSLQYGFDTGPVTLKVDLAGIVQPKGYFLVEMNQGTIGLDLPAGADQVATPFINMNAGSGKVALVDSTVILGTDYTRADVIDFVGYGASANAFEGIGTAVAPSATLAIQRVFAGCQDTNNNAADFVTLPANLSAPRNSASPTNTCTATAACPVYYCAADYNRDLGLNLDDLGDFITDFYFVPPIPGGYQPAAPSYNDRALGFGFRCPLSMDAAPPYSVDAYRRTGYRVGFSSDGSNSCPLDPTQTFPNLDNLNDYITLYYSEFGLPPCSPTE